MPLTTASRLGPYEIISPLGQGGMGEVYRARDTRLDRTVAIKVLPELLAADPQFRERFDREARTISQLAHPNICVLHDVGRHEGTDFLVLEYLEGDSLAERIAKGPLKLSEALQIAVEVAGALAAAHHAGVVHRDLKPGNVMLTPGGAKLLDFGLAKSSGGVARGFSPGALTAPPTMTTPLTAQGSIVGTFQYMAPEQLEGKEADVRSDIFAFGAMLFELLTGKRAFAGKTQVSVMAAILEYDPPPVTTLDPAMPVALNRIVQKCLDKDPAKRWQCAADLADELRWIAEQPSVPSAQPGEGAAAPVAAPRRRLAQVVAAAVAAGVVATLGIGFAARALMPSVALHPARFAIVPPQAQPLAIQGADRDIAISPDGLRIVYPAGPSRQLVVRALDQLDAQPFAGIVGVRSPFISPDGRWIGYFAGGELKKVAMSGGPPITLCPVSSTPRGASWAADTIYFATTDVATGILSVPAGGGDPKVVTKPQPGEADHWFPAVLPGGNAVLFTLKMPGALAGNDQVVAVDLKTGQRKTLLRGASQAEYLATGHLVYAAAGTLRAVRFDPKRLDVSGEAMPVLEQVLTMPTGASNYTVSGNGSLVYVPGGVQAQQSTPRSLVWVDRRGKEAPINAPPRSYLYPRISPDGTRIALDIRDQENDIWIWDVRRLTLTRLTFDPALEQLPAWTPDGRRVLFASTRGGGVQNVYWQAADGTGAAEKLVASNTPEYPVSVSPDGTRLAVQQQSPGTGSDIGVMTLDGQRRSTPLIHTTFAEWTPDISPDGHWLTYSSNESGQDEIYVRPFPGVDGGRWQISTGGGTRPLWSKTGRELFYMNRDGVMTAVPVQVSSTTFSAGNPATLFDTKYFSGGGVNGRTYDVSADGQRFLMIKESISTTSSTATPASMVVVLNWFDDLKARVAAR